MKKFLAVILGILLCLSSVSLFACGESKSEYTFTAPDGAPALAIAKFIEDKENFGLNANISYSVTSADKIGLALTQGTSDFVIAPVNLASKLYNASSDGYKMLSVVTHGNLYIAIKSAITIQDLKGKVVGAIGKGAVPGLTFTAVLEKNGIEYAEGDVAIDGKVVIQYFNDASLLIPQLKTGKLEIGLLPEPAVSNLSKMESAFAYRLDVQELYNPTLKAYPQAVLMVKNSVLEKNPNLANAVKDKFDANVLWVKDNTASAVNAVKGVLLEGLTPSLKAEAITSQVVDNCKIYWKSSKDAVTYVSEYINSLIALNPMAAKVVTSDFFA